MKTVPAIEVRVGDRIKLHPDGAAFAVRRIAHYVNAQSNQLEVNITYVDGADEDGVHTTASLHAHDQLFVLEAHDELIELSSSFAEGYIQGWVEAAAFHLADVKRLVERSVWDGIVKESQARAEERLRSEVLGLPLR